MRGLAEHDDAQGRHVEGVPKRDVGYDLTKLDHRPGELRLIEMKGLAGTASSVAERREVTTVKHYHLSVDALKQPMQVRVAPSVERAMSEQRFGAGDLLRSNALDGVECA